MVIATNSESYYTSSKNLAQKAILEAIQLHVFNILASRTFIFPLIAYYMHDDVCPKLETIFHPSVKY